MEGVLVTAPEGASFQFSVFSYLIMEVPTVISLKKGFRRAIS